MNTITLDKQNSLVNVGNSILDFFGVKPFHDTYAPLNEILKNTKKKKIALILLDGFGKVIVEHYKKDIPFMYKHIFKEYKSVFPPTTVAATTALTTGKFPLETGYIGWTQRFKEKNAYINVFITNNAFNRDQFFEPRVTDNELHVDYLWDLINKAGKYKATSIQSFAYRNDEGIENTNKFFEEADKLVKENNFVYIYSANPDHLLHNNGLFNAIIKKNLKYLDKKVKELVKNNPDTLFLLTPDHGFMDVEEISVLEHEDFVATLEDPLFYVEGRFAAFNVKDKDNFLKLAKKYYGEYFDIYSRETILNMNTFGNGELNKYADETLGDYFLVSKDKYIFYNGENPIGFKGAHAGVTPQETDIYLMLFNE